MMKTILISSLAFAGRLDLRGSMLAHNDSINSHVSLPRSIKKIKILNDAQLMLKLTGFIVQRELRR